LIKKIIFLFQIFVIYFLSINISFADIQTNLINKITATKTLSFNFKQQIAEKNRNWKMHYQIPIIDEM